MEITRKEVLEVLTTDGKPINEGDVVVVENVDGKTYAGVFGGVTKRDALILTNLINNGTFVISSKCVKSINKGTFKFD